jgi:hypothetical protein
VTRAGIAGYEARADRVTAAGHDDGNRVSGPLSRQDRDDVDSLPHEFGGERGQNLGLALGSPDLDDEVLPLHPPELTQALKVSALARSETGTCARNSRVKEPARAGRGTACASGAP